jgi:hypothetical protein
MEEAVHWLAHTIETESLLRDIVDSAHRISTLVDAAKQYSQLDRAPHQWSDLHEGRYLRLSRIGPGIRSAAGFLAVARLPRTGRWPGPRGEQGSPTG